MPSWPQIRAVVPRELAILSLHAVRAVADALVSSIPPMELQRPLMSARRFSMAKTRRRKASGNGSKITYENPSTPARHCPGYSEQGLFKSRACGVMTN